MLHHHAPDPVDRKEAIVPYRQAATACVVHLIRLHRLSDTTLTQCQMLRQEAGRLWTNLVQMHATARDQGQRLQASDLEQATKGGQYALGSQTVQALCQKVAANLATARDLRQQEAAQGTITTRYPHHPKPYQTVIWKDQGIVWDHPGFIGLKNGLGRPYLYLPIPARYQEANIRTVELIWRADHYELCLTLDTGHALPPALPTGEVAGIDLGEVHIAAVTTTRRQGLILSGRLLRSYKQARNKAHAALQAKLSRCQADSRRAKRLRQRKAEVSAKLYRQQREILHQAARQVIGFCRENEVRRIVVGDVRDIQTGVSLGQAVNQKISQWPHGQFYRYLQEKAARVGMTVEWIDEAYSTKTCAFCTHVQATSPRGRRFRCAGRGVTRHRDGNGSDNICSKGAYGVYGRVQSDRVKYRRPIVVAPATRANVASAS
jgi:putative transposase